MGAGLEHLEDRALLISGVSRAEIGDDARDANLALHELTELSSSLEQVYLQLKGTSVEYAADPKATQ
ncbi:MAG: hypothetical protein M3454_08690 [Actinomycetota bacterium]|nr:hypothetical protein [Actinomycetota bacterium]